MPTNEREEPRWSMEPPPGPASGFRGRPSTASLSYMDLLAALAWLCVASVAAVILSRAAFGFALVLAALQVALIGVSYMRVVHEDRLHLALLAVGGVFAALFFAAVVLDRNEYGSTLERFDEAPLSGPPATGE